MTRAGRHSWTQEPQRFEHHSDRACYHCGLIKRTRHEGRQHWIEFDRRRPDGSLERVPGKHTPPCPGPPEQQAMTITRERIHAGEDNHVTRQEHA